MTTKQCDKCGRVVEKLHRVAFDNQVGDLCGLCISRYETDFMIKHNAIDLYLFYETKHVKESPADDMTKPVIVPAEVGNWTGDLKFPVIAWSKGNHNMCDGRIDVWFRFNGFIWWGWNVGDHDIVRCKQTKRRNL